MNDRIQHTRHVTHRGPLLERGGELGRDIARFIRWFPRQFAAVPWQRLQHRGQNGRVGQHLVLVAMVSRLPNAATSRLTGLVSSDPRLNSEFLILGHSNSPSHEGATMIKTMGCGSAGGSLHCHLWQVGVRDRRGQPP